MLLELRVEDLLLIDSARLALAPGLNVITGETGAGKTVLAHALDLLLGGRARPGIVRPGAAEAYVEGIFELPAQLAPRWAERLPADAEELVLARRVGADGRTRAYINGRAASVGDLRELTGDLISFYGQHEHRRLTVSASQLEILDGFCGGAQLERRAACAAAHAQVLALQARVAELTDRAGARERELDLLAFELSEIDAAAPQESEHAELLAQRSRLRHRDALVEAARAAAGALSGDEEQGAAALLAAGAERLHASAGLDAALDPLGERLAALALEAEDLAGELRRYRDDEEAETGRLEAVEERLLVLDRLARKHGGSIAAVLDHAQDCRRRREDLQAADSDRGEQERRLQEARAQWDLLAAALSRGREQAAEPLAAAVRVRLAALAMERAYFDIELSARAPGPSGRDTVEFMIAPNPGVPAGPLREIASGGELSRVMLALMGVAAGASAEATLVFDEVDAGIGGQTARAVGEQLRALAAQRQVLCITHLPQVASLAARHFSITKDVGVEPARTAVSQLAEADVVSELVRMLGSDVQDRAARRHATELRRAA